MSAAFQALDCRSSDVLRSLSTRRTADSRIFKKKKKKKKGKGKKEKGVGVGEGEGRGEGEGEG